MAVAGLMFDDFSRCESPIEVLLQLAMAAASRRHRLEWSDADCFDALRDCALAGRDQCLVVGSQVWVSEAKPRIDFVMILGGLALAIECDGFAYHRATEDMKARDRFRDARLAGLVGMRTERIHGSFIFSNSKGVLSHCLGRFGLLPLSRAVPTLSPKWRAFAMRWPPPQLEALSGMAQTLASTNADLQTALREMAA